MEVTQLTIVAELASGPSPLSLLDPHVCKLPVPWDPRGPRGPSRSMLARPPSPETAPGQRWGASAVPGGRTWAGQGPPCILGCLVTGSSSARAGSREGRFRGSSGWEAPAQGPPRTAGWRAPSGLSVGAAGTPGGRERPTSGLRGAGDGQQEQEDSGPQGCSSQTRHLGEKCPGPLSAPRFIPKA